MDIRLIAIAAALPLAACTQERTPVESTPPPPAEMTCNADAGASFVGQAATPDLGGAIVKATGARTLRWGPPRSAMTPTTVRFRLNGPKLIRTSCPTALCGVSKRSVAVL